MNNQSTPDGPHSEPGPDSPNQGGMSEEDTQALIKQLRGAPAAEILVDIFSSLLSTAQVKIGRRDARLFIDLAAQALEYAKPHLPDDVTAQIEGALGQLRMAQVTEEQEVAQQEEPEPNDLDRIPSPPSSTTTGDSTGTPPDPSPASRLWVPGQ